MRRHLHRLLLAAAGSLALAALAAPPVEAAQSTYCVHQPSDPCPAGAVDEGANFQNALTAAQGTADNVVDVGPGTYTAPSLSPFTYNSAHPLQIVGAGVGRTTIAGGGSDTLKLTGPANVSQLSITGGALTLSLNGGASADHVDVSGGHAVALNQGTLRSSTVTGAPGVITQSTAASEIDDSAITAANDQAVYAMAPTTIHRSTLSGGTALQAQAVPVVVDDSLIFASGTGLLATDSGSAQGSFNALNDTIVALSNAAIGVEVATSSGGGDAQLFNSIVHGFGTSFQTNGPLSTIERSYDNSDGSVSPNDGKIFDDAKPVTGDPGFVNPGAGDYRLAGGSALIDRSPYANLGGSSLTDRDGNPRSVGFKDTKNPVDIGAYEYQHRPPSASATVTPASAVAGSSFSFDGSQSSDPDDGDSLTYAWSFDDGGKASGSKATHTFASAGKHTATLTVTDPTGLSASQTLTVSVTAPAGPPSTPGSPTPQLIALGGPSASGQQASLTLACTSTAASCAGDVIETTVERVRSGKVVGLSAARKRRVRRRTVVVGSVGFSIQAGGRGTLKVSPNAAGRKLLKRFGKLPVTVTVRLRTPAGNVTVETAHVTLRAAKKHRHHRRKR